MSLICYNNDIIQKLFWLTKNRNVKKEKNILLFLQNQLLHQNYDEF